MSSLVPFCFCSIQRLRPSLHKWPALDGLRALSITLVLAGHMLPLGPKSWGANAPIAATGMALFFVLSGFLITRALITNQNIGQFLTRRFARILPLAYLYLVVLAIAFSYGPKFLLVNFLFAENYVTGELRDYNGHLWSLCVEMHFYLAIALVVFMLGRRGIWAVWPACLAVTTLRIVEGEWITILTHLRVDEILAGACVATLYCDDWKKLNVSPFVFFALLVALVISSYHNPFAYLRPYVAGLVLATSLSLASGLTLAVLSSAIARYIATISYALYVWHPLTQAGWLGEGGGFERYLIKRPISFALTFLIAHVSTFYYEKRWTDWASSIRFKQKTA